MLPLLFVIGCAGTDESLRQSEELIRSGRHDEAVSLLAQVIAADDRNPKARILMAQAHEALENYDRAIPQFKAAIRLYVAQPEDRAMARLQLAKIYLRLGVRKEGVNQLRAIVHSTSDSAVIQQVAGLVSDAYQVVQITKGNPANYSPSFSPDGEQIAFASSRLGNGEIYLMDVNGSNLQQVTFTPDFNDDSPRFLGDSRYIVHSREPKSAGEIHIVLQSDGTTPVYAGIYVTRLDREVTHELLPLGLGVRAPCLSPDWKRVVYEASRDRTLDLYTLDLNDVDLENVGEGIIIPTPITDSEADEGSPTFFPDGKRIAFVSAGPEGTGPRRVAPGRSKPLHQIYTINIDGTDETHLNPNPYDCYSPVIAPDGKTMAFVSGRMDDIEIYLMDIDGTNERRITNGIGVSVQPAFSPDGQKLAFVSDRSGTLQIYLMSFDQPVTRDILIQHLQGE
ncbi:PD40 domain-containing protein [Candidatus Poribacteria bacterium]|nr:PD40 domain-containing protein [Candidatus Poribacteria bacterium]